jgi:hypothetical protein
MIAVHLRINDAATGRPTPVRLRVSGPDGTAYPPLGRLAAFACGRGEDVGGHLRVGKESFAYVDGACEIPLPTGVPLRVRATKGPEYEPLDRTVTLGAGQMALRFELRRWSDLAGDGWHAGDTRAHFLSPHAAMLEAAAEDVAVVNVLACATSHLARDGNTYAAVPNMTAFGGQTPALAADGRVVAVNTFNTHPALGRVGLLNCHRAVFPLAFGEPDGPDDWSVLDWCRQCHRKNGLAVWADAFRTGGGLPGGEALVAAILGELDALEIDAHPRPVPLVGWYYRLLNAGLRLPLAGGSGKDSNRVPIGGVRTYARADGPLTYGGWVEAVRAGRTVVTNGPLLRLTADGVGPGGTVERPAEGGTLRVVASAESLGPFEWLQVIADGETIASVPAVAGGRHAAAVELEHAVTGSGWLAARCVGGQPSVLVPGMRAFAHTSPVWVGVGGRPLPRRADAVAAVRECVAQTREWAERHGRYQDEKWRRKLVAACDAATERLEC